MSSKVNCSQEGAKLNMSVEGRFDFSILQAFRDAYTHDIDGEVAQVEIDLARADHLDSSGMGLLLTLKKDLSLEPGSVHLVNCRPHIKDALLAARLDHFFKVN